MPLIRIAVDAMGGDRAPKAIIEGSLAALEAYEDIYVQLVGSAEALQGTSRDRLEVVLADEVVAMDEHPGTALRKKPNASIAVCGRLMKEGATSAIVSAGNTGAVIAASMFSVRLLDGVHRPGIAVAFNTSRGTTVLCDAGANIQMKPLNYLQYAVMASAYSEYILGVDSPRVALLNIGTEETKGTSELREIRQLLEAAGQAGLIHFVGAVEGNHIFEGRCDVVVCDGFTGNTILKTAEGVGQAVVAHYAAFCDQDELNAEQQGWFKRGLQRLYEITDYTSYGGAPLLGIDGCGIIAHGKSDARAIKNAIRVARDFARQEVNKHIAARLAELVTKGVAEASPGKVVTT